MFEIKRGVYYIRMRICHRPIVETAQRLATVGLGIDTLIAIILVII